LRGHEHKAASDRVALPCQPGDDSGEWIALKRNNNDIETDVPILKEQREKFQERLKVCIRETGNIANLSNLSGLSVHKLKGFTYGSGEPARDELRKIARAAGVRTGWLIDGEDPMHLSSSLATLKSDEVLIPVELQREGPTPTGVRDLVISTQMLKDKAGDGAIRIIYATQEIAGCVKQGDLLLTLLVDSIDVSGLYIFSSPVGYDLRRVLVDRILGKCTMLTETGPVPLEFDQLAELKVVGRVVDIWRTLPVTEALLAGR